MADLNRRNVFGRKGEKSGKFFEIDYSEAWLRLKRGEDVYEKVLPDRSYTPREKARIPWTPVKLVEEQ
jgi:hypothetical protein